MEASEIKLGDWARMFVGEVPAEFYVELLVRSAFVYLLLLICIRLLGKRMSAQLNRNELAALVSLAAAIGVPLQAPDRGLLPALVVAIVIIGISRAISMLIYYSPKAELISQGNYAELVHEGVLQLRSMALVRITRERLFSILREQGIRHLGEVKRLYFEAGAAFTLVRKDPAAPGLPVIPEWDHDYVDRQKPDPDHKACRSCGHIVEAGFNGRCGVCEDDDWTTALT